MTAFYATDRRIVPFEGRSRQTVPQLLVSVRNGDEARLALAGGCDILDVKEPSRGSLGMADAAQIEDVLHAARGGPTAVPVSIALGDAVDWINPRRPSLSDELAHGAGQTFLKLGTAGLADEPDWPDRWGAARRRLTDDAGPRWIMVGYADAQPAKSPAIEEIV
jgi:(5-formylfuran-3-yl)methyl phosphate synthase